jgi:hypothetical protein
MAKAKKGAEKAEVAEKVRRATATMRRDFAAAKARLAKLQAQGMVAFDAYWETVASLTEGERPLYLGGGYRSVKAFIAAELPDENERTVRRNVLVARCFSPADESKHGINFLEEVALFAQAQAGAAEPPRAIDLDRLKIPVVTRDGDHRSKPARDATIAEIRSARRGATKGASRKRSSPTETAVRAALAKTPALRGVTVRYAGGALSLGSIPLQGLPALLKALAKLKLPIPD